MFGLGGGNGEWFFNEEVFAGVESLAGVVEVGVVGGVDDDEVEGGVVDEVVDGIVAGEVGVGEVGFFGGAFGNGR